MAELDPGTIVPNLIAGPAVFLVSLLVVRFRREIFKTTAAFEKAIFGQLGDAVAQRQSALWVGVAGAFGMCLGLAQIAYGVVGLIQSLI